ncbi:MAG: 50S ribosomal protein L10 [Gemmatimonadales bacterium]|jgi:large subunit ribosomal protein L10|nr:MAG: 50S ribosomal protein L10 [Gemmatimonadales bacterium]
MDRNEKETFVAEFRERLDRSSVVYLTDFTGLNVKSMTDLRQKLKDTGAEYLVAKNRLVKRALEGTDLPELGDALTGPSGVIFGYDDVVTTAKVLSEFAKAHDDRPAFKLGVLDNKILDPAQLDRLAKLPPREQLLAELAGAFEAPMAALAGALEAKMQEMAGLLDAYKAQKQEAGE